MRASNFIEKVRVNASQKDKRDVSEKEFGNGMLEIEEILSD
jgi:hypothetical protein